MLLEVRHLTSVFLRGRLQQITSAFPERTNLRHRERSVFPRLRWERSQILHSCQLKG